MAGSSGSGALCHQFVDGPHAVVIVLAQEVTCKQCDELGKILGAHGFTGRFVGGTVAELALLGAQKKREDMMRSAREKKGAE